MAFMSSQKRRKWRTSSVDASEKDADADADAADVKDINANAYGETIRVADTLAMNTEYNKVTPTTRTKRMNTPSKKRVDFRFGDRQTEEQEVEENAKVLEDRVVDISATPIRETAPAPSGMHVNEKEDNDDDIEAEVFVDAQEENEDQNEFKLPLREIFRAKHLFDPRDGSQLAPISNVQVLRDESFTTSADEKYRHRYDHFLACEIDHEIRDATEISVWKIEENCGCDSGSGSGSGRGNSSSSSDNSRSNDERASMKNDSSFKSSFKGTVLIGKPSARDGTSTSGISSKKIKRWAYSIAPNGLVFTSAYTKSSLFSMDETERTHESSEDEEDEEEFSLRGITERAFPTKSGVYVHDPVDVNKKIHASSSAEKSRRRSSGRRRSSTRGASTMGTSFPEVKKKPTTTTTTYFELQSPGMAGKVHPREFASAFSEEYDETVFRLAGVGAEGKCRLWTWSCDEEGDDAFDDDATVYGDDLLPKLAYEAGSWDAELRHGQLSECSGRGACSRKGGTCSCETGFAGRACERALCPGGIGEFGACSGHGLCLPMRDLVLRDDALPLSLAPPLSSPRPLAACAPRAPAARPRFCPRASAGSATRRTVSSARRTFSLTPSSTYSSWCLPLR